MASAETILAADASVGAEIWAGGVRLYIHGYAEQDRSPDHEPMSCWRIAPEAVPSNMPLVIECQDLLTAAARRMRVCE